EHLLIENTDPIKHEMATYEVEKAGYKTQKTNRTLLAKTSQTSQVYVKNDSGEFLVKCNLHPFLQTRGLMVDNPYYAISDDEGRFSIPEIPPGTYEIVAWHPFIPNRKGTVTVEPGQTARIDFEFDGKDEKRRLYHDDFKGYRFNTWFDSPETFYGEPRRDDPVEILQSFRNPIQPGS
ncbi:MAG: carboxypeptidase-like regulatory domain-containing protein, partial [Nitrospinaceae bacterium]